MPSRRVLKAAEAIREVVSMAILAELKDPRVRGVTVTGVEVSADMRSAKVKVSIMGTEAQQRTCMHGLQSSAGYLQSKIAKRIETRYTPRLEFVADPGVKKSIEIAQILHRVLPPDETAADEEPPEEEDSAGDEETAESNYSDRAADAAADDDDADSEPRKPR